MAVALPVRALAMSRIAGVAGVDAVLVASLLGLAGAVRWPYLLLSPQFPSVGATILRALDVADGRALHLVDQAPYLGAPFVYLLAAVYKVFGSSVEATLLLPWALGTLTVVPTYLLGRQLGGRVAGLAAGALLATSGAHTVITSHVPQSHSLTPLLSTTVLWLLARAVGAPPRRSAPGSSLLLAGFVAGLSLQSHPTVAPLLVGAAAVVAARRPAWLRSRRTYLALAFVIVGYSTLMIHHLQSRFEVVADVQGKQARYLDADDDAGEDAGRGVYVNNLGQLLLSVARLSSGAIDARESAADYLSDPRVLAYPIIAAAGLTLVPTGAGLLLPAIVPSILLPPLLSGKYQPILDGRYLMPLLPVLFVAIGLALDSVLARVGGVAADPRRAAALRGTIAAAGASVAVLAVLLVAHPLSVLASFYEESQEDGFSNALYLRTLDQIRAERSGNGAVVLDARLSEVKSAGGGSAGASFGWVLAASRIPTETWRDGDDPSRLSGRLAILHRATVERLGDSLAIRALDARRPSGRDRQSYRAYRVAAP